jgi:hypothetical protein
MDWLLRVAKSSEILLFFRLHLRPTRLKICLKNIKGPLSINLKVFIGHLPTVNITYLRCKVEDNIDLWYDLTQKIGVANVVFNEIIFIWGNKMFSYFKLLVLFCSLK